MQWPPEIWYVENCISILKLNFYSTWIFHAWCNSQVIQRGKQHHWELTCRKCAPHVPSYKSNLYCSSYYDTVILLWYLSLWGWSISQENSDFDNQAVVRRLSLITSQGELICWTDGKWIYEGSLHISIHRYFFFLLWALYAVKRERKGMVWKYHSVQTH